MRHRIFFRRIHLGKGSSVSVVRNEHTVVTEPVGAALAVGNRSGTLTPQQMNLARRMHQRNDGAEPCATVRLVAESRKQQRPIRRVIGWFAGKSRAVHAGFAPERINFETGVIGNRPGTRCIRDLDSLDDRVSLERWGGLFDVADIARTRKQVDVCGEKSCDLCDLVRVRTRTDDAHVDP